MHLLFIDGMVEIGQLEAALHSFPGQDTSRICNFDTDPDTQASSNAG